MDIDGFKRINDAFGHDVGDEVLKMVARTLSRNVRSGDMVCRWGGEEFVAIVAHLNRSEELMKIAEKLRLLVANSSVSSEEALINPHISVGATLCRADDSEESLLKRADRLMYLSKEKGGNSVSMDQRE